VGQRTLEARLPQKDLLSIPTAITAATASASAEAPATGNLVSGSSDKPTSSEVNTPATAVAREQKRRSQPRTVDGGRANPCAIFRCPHPEAAASNAAPITSTVSARRDRPLTGSSTCVRPQRPEHLPRRGHSSTRCPSRPRRHRSRPCPHGASTPAHSGQASRPVVNRCSTSAASTPTVTNVGLRAHEHGPPDTGCNEGGRAVAYQDMVTVPPSTININTNDPTEPTSPPPTATQSPYVLILGGKEQRHAIVGFLFLG